MDAYLIRVSKSEATKILKSKAAVEAVINRGREHPDRMLDLEEAWAGIHVTLTAEPPIPRQEALARDVSWDDDTLENVLMGGLATPRETSFGPARYLSPDRVTVLADHLARIDGNTFMQGYDVEYLEGLRVPPDNWSEDVETRNWLEEKYRQLVEFYRKAAEQGEGVLIGFL